MKQQHSISDIEKEIAQIPINAAKERILLENEMKEDLLSVDISLANNDIMLNIKKIESESRMLQIACEKKLASLDELKKSLLQKAFSGELTKTEGHAA